ncbi:protein P200 isoform X2 [Anopheles funestus]|uniref:protein P200 isoform X2 n=1 Tax=Anopheles funestus TaxID=62324 RepID=UPI0020C70C5F|nr:protein P200 isoform X2 [Anopheles funestus]
MATATGHRMESNSGMGPRKTMIIMVTVVGCVAILWPKVFYPMMVGNGQNKNVIKDHRGAGIRQERPPHLRPEAMHPAMRERGRAIPQSGSIHGGERPQSAPRIVEGRPGPIPGMRPPMGAGSHQATKSANSMGFIMPLYTIGIVSFFIYTIMKLIFKKTPATPYAEVKPDPAFRNEVFTTEQYIKRPDDGTTKLDQSHVTAATNGELVVPVAVSSVSAEPSSVQSELSIDYEQLSKQKEIAKPDESSAAEHVTLEHEPAVQEIMVQDDQIESTETVSEERAEEFFTEQQLAHDPTTEKVVDGIVVKKVAAVEESAVPASQSSLEDGEESKIQEESVLKAVNGTSSPANDDIIDLSKQRENDQVQRESEVNEPVIEEIMLVKQTSMQYATIAPSDEDQTISADEPDVAQQMKQEITSADETTNLETKENGQHETVTEVLAEELVESLTATIMHAAEKDEVQEHTPILEINEVSELLVVQSSSAAENEPQILEESAAITTTEQPSDQAVHETSENTPIKPIESIMKEDLIEVSYPKQEIELIQNPLVQDPIEPESTMAEITKEIQEIISEDIPQSDAVSAEIELKESQEIISEDIPQNDAVSAEIELKETRDETIKEQQNVPQLELEPTDKVIADDAIKEQQNVPQLELEQTDKVIADDAIKEQQNVPQLELEQTDKVIADDAIKEQQNVPQLELEQTAKVIDLATETTDLVHKTVEDITLTAEQLVQEVLEHAEELAKQQDQYPGLPEHDPATQKLVDGIVVERFDHPETEQPEDTDAIVSHEFSDEQETVTQEPTVEEMELAAAIEQTLIEEDAGEMDSISEDTSLSVASVIEQQPKAKETEESNTVPDVVCTTDEKTDSTTGDVTFIETKNLSVNETILATEVVQEQVDVNEPGNKFGVAAVDSSETDVVIEEQPLPKVSEEHGTVSEALITTELLTSTSSEPVFVELNDQPTVEAETVLEETNKVNGAGNLSGAAAADSTDNRSVSIEEVHDEAAIVDEVEGKETNVNADEPEKDEKETAAEVTAAEEDHAKVSNGHAIKPVENAAENESSEKETSGGESSSANSTPEKKPKKRDTSTERGTVKVMAMEVTAQRENGKRLSRPSTPLLPMGGHSESANVPTEEHETRSIVLDGRLPHDSKILVSDAETAVEKLEPENSEEEDDAPVILSGKMTLSLINMDFIEKDATGTVAVGEIVTELHKPQEDLTTTSAKDAE